MALFDACNEAKLSPDQVVCPFPRIWEDNTGVRLAYQKLPMGKGQATEQVVLQVPSTHCAPLVTALMRRGLEPEVFHTNTSVFVRFSISGPFPTTERYVNPDLVGDPAPKCPSPVFDIILITACDTLNDAPILELVRKYGVKE
jgi:hypothetical protein